jgi:hypothetical protein
MKRCMPVRYWKFMPEKERPLLTVENRRENTDKIIDSEHKLITHAKLLNVKNDDSKKDG